MRLFELLCLTDLAGLIPFEEWKSLYKSWIRREYDEDFTTVRLWAKKVLHKKDYIDINSVLYSHTAHFPRNIQSNIIYSIRNRHLIHSYLVVLVWVLVWFWFWFIFLHTFPDVGQVPLQLGDIDRSSGSLGSQGQKNESVKRNQPLTAHSFPLVVAYHDNLIGLHWGKGTYWDLHSSWDG